LAWLYTGPLGHLYGIIADIALMWVRYGVARLRRWLAPLVARFGR
jgi:hypothetical protein